MRMTPCLFLSVLACTACTSGADDTSGSSDIPIVSCEAATPDAQADGAGDVMDQSPHAFWLAEDALAARGATRPSTGAGALADGGGCLTSGWVKTSLGYC